MANSEGRIVDDALQDLPEDDELAFSIFETRIREKYDILASATEDYRYERDYVTAVIAFISASNLNFDLSTSVPPKDNDFKDWYRSFRTKVSFITNRIKIQRHRSGDTSSIAYIEFQKDDRDQISKLIEKIRKIVRASDIDNNKKDAIFKRLEALQYEIDRSKTRLDTLLARFLDVSNTLGEASERLEPLAKLMERIVKIFGRAKTAQDLKEIGAEETQPKLPAPDSSETTVEDD